MLALTSALEQSLQTYIKDLFYQDRFRFQELGLFLYLGYQSFRDCDIFRLFQEAQALKVFISLIFGEEIRFL